ncbi:MAG: sigma-70 family RNA polymerase sigma factor [Bernardetiaceae bacterium]|nr:sigma-70 family RNA polymerase sigma factor [Bernardetiaceae bacterium]
MLNTSKTIAEENSLINLLKQKDKKGFSLLYENYAPTLYGVVLRIVGNKEVAEDTLQEVFIKIWKHIEQYNATKGTLFTWMLNIARNTSIDKLRSKSYKKMLYDSDIEALQEQISDGNKAEEQTDRIGISELLEHLGQNQKDVIDLIYFEGFTQAEAADVLDIPLGTVKTRIRTAIHSLRKLI